MSQDKQKRREEAKAEVHRLAPLIVRVARTFVQCVTVPNRQENEDGEEAFANALFTLLEEVAESKLL